MFIHHKKIHANKSIEARTGLNKETIIVIPCYNEEKRLDTETFLRYAQSNPDTGFLFVDDGSRDRTLAILVSLRIFIPEQFGAITLSRNRGKAEAVRIGMLSAIEIGARNVGYWDADLATPLNAINDFCAILNRYNDIELVYGARRMLMGHRINRTWDRRIVSRICATLARVAISLPVSDTQCGAKVFRSSETLKSALAQPFTAGWLFDVELFSRLARELPEPSRAFYELPLAEWQEIEGSKITSSAIIRAGFSVLRLIAQNRLPGVASRMRRNEGAISAATASWVNHTADLKPAPKSDVQLAPTLPALISASRAAA